MTPDDLAVRNATYRWDRLDPGWRPHVREQNQAVLDRLGLTGDCWRLG